MIQIVSIIIFQLMISCKSYCPYKQFGYEYYVMQYPLIIPIQDSLIEQLLPEQRCDHANDRDKNHGHNDHQYPKFKFF